MLWKWNEILESNCLETEDFAKFCRIEAQETSDIFLDNVRRDLDRVREMLEEEKPSNECLRHPWFTNAQIAILDNYLDGEFSFVLSNPSRNAAYQKIAEEDAMLGFMLAACDRRLTRDDAFVVFSEMERTCKNATQMLICENPPLHGLDKELKAEVLPDEDGNGLEIEITDKNGRTIDNASGFGIDDFRPEGRAEKWARKAANAAKNHKQRM